jgi:hypothetical protein
MRTAVVIAVFFTGVVLGLVLFQAWFAPCLRGAC